MEALDNSPNKKNKITDTIIEKIRDSILSGQLKPGDRLANEKEFMEEFSVSKATMREALRVLEAIGLLEIRKGVAGGAFVAEVAMRTTIHSLVNFLHFTSVSIKEITMLRYLIEPQMAKIAALCRTEEDIQKLRQMIGGIDSIREVEVQKQIGFHCYLARITKNPLLVLIVDFIDNVLKSIKNRLDLGDDFYNLVKGHHTLLLECIIQQDPHAASVMMTNDILEVGKSLAYLTGSESFDPLTLIGPGSIEEKLLGTTHLQKVVKNDDPLCNEPGAIMRRVGTSTLYLVSLKKDVDSTPKDKSKMIQLQKAAR